MRYQRWSKVKKKLENFLCDSLKARVQYHVTNYRKAHDQVGRAYITVDKQEVLNMCTIKSEMAANLKEDEIRHTQNIEFDIENREQNCEIQEQAFNEIEAEGIFSQYAFLDSAKEYFNLSIGEALKSNNILVKLFAIIDRRVGKRTLRQMKGSIQYENELIQYFYRLRCEAENISF